MRDEKPIVLVGAGGHARVVRDLLNTLERSIRGYCAIEPEGDLPYLGNDEQLLDTVSPSDVYLVNGIGAVSPQANEHRDKIFLKFKQHGFSFITLIHPSAVVSSSVTLEEGVQIMAGVVIQTHVNVGPNTIINTSSSIDHDCILGKSVHIAPGVTLSGNVKIGAFSHIGVGATIIQNITVKESTLLRAGTTLIKEA
jgi:UDP-perosamine 4-acetyltransferase